MDTSPRFIYPPDPDRYSPLPIRGQFQSRDWKGTRKEPPILCFVVPASSPDDLVVVDDVTHVPTRLVYEDGIYRTVPDPYYSTVKFFKILQCPFRLLSDSASEEELDRRNITPDRWRGYDLEDLRVVTPTTPRTSQKRSFLDDLLLA